MKNSLLAIALLALMTPALNAQCDNCQECGDKVAVGFLKKTSEKKTVYEVTEKEIAVPDICLPRPLFSLKTQLCNLFAPKCSPGKPCGNCEVKDCPKDVRVGKVRVIKVMKKTSVKCDKCTYSWEVADPKKIDEYLGTEQSDSKN